MGEKRLFRYNLGMIVLIMLQSILALFTLAVYAGYQHANYYIFMVLLLFVLVLPCIIIKTKSLKAFFRFTVLYYAFIPTSDLVVLSQLGENNNLFRLGFSLNEALEWLSVIPRELPGIVIILGFLLAVNGQRWKRYDTIILAGVLMFGIGMLLLPELTSVLLYIAVYLLILLLAAWLGSYFDSTDVKYEKIIEWILLLAFWAKGCYRMLAILEVYPPIS